MEYNCLFQAFENLYENWVGLPTTLDMFESK